MSSVPCPTSGCTGSMPGHRRVCRGCSTRLIRTLADVPSLDGDLDITRTHQSRIGEHTHAHHAETALPWDQRAAEASSALRSALTGWVWVLSDGAPIVYGPRCRACDHPSCEWADLARLPADTLPAIARWLLRHRARFLAHRAVPEAVYGITAAVRQARRVIDLPPDRIYVAPCTQCGRDLYARPAARTTACGVCHLEYDVEPQREWMRDQIPDMIGTASWVAVAAAGLGYQITASAIRSMAKRGRITARGRDAMGHPTYLVRDVLTTIDERSPADG